MKRAQFVNEAIMVDEVGIESGRYGPFRLKTLYQPIYQTRGDTLVPFGVEGLVNPFRDGETVPVSEFMGEVQRKDRMFVESMCRALHLRNYNNIGEPGLRLFFNYDPLAHDDLDAAIGQIRYMAGRLDEIGINPRLLVCEITESRALDDAMLARLAAEMRSYEIRLAIDDFGAGHSTLARVGMIEPDFVKLDGDWFRRIADVPAAARLLPPLVAALQKTGAEVLVEGIETVDQLAVALDTGSHYLQGFLLGRPAPAGTIFDPAPLHAGTLLNPSRNVVRLFRRA